MPGVEDEASDRDKRRRQRWTNTGREINPQTGRDQSIRGVGALIQPVFLFII